MRTLLTLLCLCLLAGCTEMQRDALIGTAIGTAAGMLMGKGDAKSALIGAGVGALGGGLYGKNKECNRYKTDEDSEQRELEIELQRLREENEALKANGGII